MNDFIQSCKLATTYPKNLISPGEHQGYQHTLQNYVDNLDSREKELFGPEDKASLDFWDLDDGTTSECTRQDLGDSGLMRLMVTDRIQIHTYKATGIGETSFFSALASSKRSAMPFYVRGTPLTQWRRNTDVLTDL